MVTFDFNKTPITQVADAIIIDASNRGASDIHLDPRENGIMTRIRVDGDLVDYAYIPKMYERNLTTRLKLMSNMNITENRLPQDGAIKGKFGDKDLDMRVSCLPTNEGEKIVIRILDYSRSLSGLDKLGFNQENYQKLLRMIGNPNGIILITGATGSGKSTTVYSILQALNKEETNIITVEDPIEMNIEGMNQVQVNSEIGLDFAVVLRSILRQDPNVILIGEIRDSETAQIAVRASITGHLVLSTIHTNNSLSTIERLLDMNVERYLLSSALAGIISQRLAKMLCPKCRVKRKTTPYEKKVFKLAMKKDVDEVYDANHNGCSYCHKGYRGRIAVQEVLEITEHIKSTINRTTTDNDKLRQLVYGSGNVITLLQDGLGKVLNGFTTFEEIYRIIEIDNDIEDSCLNSEEENSSKEKEEKKVKDKSQNTLDEQGKSSVKQEETNTNIDSSVSSISNDKINDEKKNTNALVASATSSIVGNQNLLSKTSTPPIVSSNPIAMTNTGATENTGPSSTEQKEGKESQPQKATNASMLPNSSIVKAEKKNLSVQKEIPVSTSQSNSNEPKHSANSQKEKISNSVNISQATSNSQDANKVPFVPVIDTEKKLEIPINKSSDFTTNSITPVMQAKQQSQAQNTSSTPIQPLISSPQQNKNQVSNFSIQKESKNPITNSSNKEKTSNNLKNQSSPNQKQSNIDQINRFFSNNLNSQVSSVAPASHDNTNNLVNNQIPISSVPNNQNSTPITKKPNINTLIFPQSQNKDNLK